MSNRPHMRPPLQGIHSRHAAKGFTLVELMVVLMLMAIFTAMIMPSMTRTLRGKNARDIGNQLHETLNFAHAAAVGRGCPAIVNIDTVRHRCWVTVAPLSLPWIEDREEAKTETLADFDLPETVSISIYRNEEDNMNTLEAAAWDTIVFRPDGRCEDTVIQLSDTDDKQFDMTIVGATGCVFVGQEL